jgi:hypothetical protein
MITSLLAIGAVALKWVGGGAGILGAISAIVRLPWISGWIAAIPVIGPFVGEAAKIVLGWLDAVVRFVARATWALLESVASKPMIAVPILLAMWGQHFYFENWKYRHWEPPAAATSSSPATLTWRTNFRRWLANRIAPAEPPMPTTQVPDLWAGDSKPPKTSTRRSASRPAADNGPFDWIDRNFRF